MLMDDLTWDFDLFFTNYAWCFACRASFEVSYFVPEYLLCTVDVIQCDRTVLNDVLA